MTDQEYTDINEATAGTPVVPEPSFPKAPEVKVNLFDECIPMLFSATLAYGFTDALNDQVHENIGLDLPEEFQGEGLEVFRTESWDLRKFNDGNGISFEQINSIVELNSEKLMKSFEKDPFYQKVPERIRKCFRETNQDLSKVYLTFNRNAQRDVSCVYAVMKDVAKKQVIVAFRGSRSDYETRDWPTNLNARLRALETPDKIKDKLKGILRERVLVHRGFYNYLFDNSKREGLQQYDQLIQDIRHVINGEEGYSVYVTGHSLGAALAHMFSFKLAGAGPETNDIPRPISCITYACPFLASAGYRTATEYMERDKLLRTLRITNQGDMVPTIPPFSLLRLRLLKHVGTNLFLSKSGKYLIKHSSRTGFRTALRYNFAWPLLLAPCNGSRLHSLDEHYNRMLEYKGELEKKTIDELYKDPSVVSKDFLDGKPL